MEVAELLERTRPVALAGQRTLPVEPALAGLLPAGLPRGATVALLPGPGGGAPDLSLLPALTAGASAAGSWCAVVGLPELGVEAAAALGVDLDRLVLVPEPKERWPTVVSALLDGVDVVVLGLSQRVRPRMGDARRLSARARHQGSLLMVLGPSWPEPPELALAVTGSSWEGLGRGHGHLLRRRVEVEVSGRRAGRPRRASLWLPSDSGRAEVWKGRNDLSVLAPVVRRTRVPAAMS